MNTALEHKTYIWTPLRDGTVVIDELCTCGHKRSEHGGIIAQGHGSCFRCNCSKFTWKDWITIPNPELKD